MTKPYSRIIYNEKFKRLVGSDENDIYLSILCSLLTSDVGCYSETFKELIYDDSCREGEGNTTILFKEGEYILLADLFSEEDDKGPFLRLHRDELGRILDQWKEFCRTKPKEILITKEDNKIVMIPTYE